MTPKRLVEEICSEFIERLIDENESLLSSTKAEECSDGEYRKLVEAWSVADKEQQEVFREFYRLGSQNSVASILNLIDQELVLQTQDGKQLGGDLLDIFWEQQEKSDHVNRST